MHVAWVAPRAADRVEVHPAIRAPRQQLHRRAYHDGEVGRLVRERVGTVTGDDLAAARHLGHERDEVAHRAAGHEQGGFLAGQLRRALLERDDGRVVAEDVVAQLSLGHRPAHLGRGLGDGVGAQVDEVVGHGGARV